MSKKKALTGVAAAQAEANAVVASAPETSKVAEISDQEMTDSEELRKLNTRLRRDHGINLAEAINRIFWRHGFGADMRD